MSCGRTHGSTVAFNNIGVVAAAFEFNFAKKKIKKRKLTKTDMCVFKTGD